MTGMRTVANWGGQGLHPRGNFEGFVRARPPRTSGWRSPRVAEPALILINPYP